MPRIVCYLEEDLLDQINELSKNLANDNRSRMVSELLSIGIAHLKNKKIDFDILELYKEFTSMQLQNLEISKNILRSVNKQQATGFRNTDDLEKLIFHKSNEYAEALAEGKKSKK